MVKPSEISRQIIYKFTDAVAKLLERPPCVPAVVCSIRCQVIPKNLNMIILQVLFRLAISIETEMVGLLQLDWVECYVMCLVRDILVRQPVKVNIDLPVI